MSHAQSRRKFLQHALAAGTAVPLISSASTLPALATIKRRAPSERIQIGVVGCAGRGKANVDAVSHEQIVALCDIDAHNLEATRKDLVAKKRVPQDVPTFKDFR